MNNSDIFSILKSQVADVMEIPAPVAHPGAPAHEGKPYRDPYLYINCPPQKWLQLAAVIKENNRLSFDLLTMLTAVDYLKTTTTELSRMDVVYHFYSYAFKHKLVVKVPVRRENASVPSVVSIWTTADWQEREVFDMYGIQFQGHPNLKRIFMWDGFPGWPLRKDYVHIPDRYDD